jgi:hypothetical protein
MWISVLNGTDMREEQGHKKNKQWCIKGIPSNETSSSTSSVAIEAYLRKDPPGGKSTPFCHRSGVSYRHTHIQPWLMGSVMSKGRNHDINGLIWPATTDILSLQTNRLSRRPIQPPESVPDDRKRNFRNSASIQQNQAMEDVPGNILSSSSQTSAAPTSSWQSLQLFTKLSTSLSPLGHQKGEHYHDHHSPCPFKPDHSKLTIIAHPGHSHVLHISFISF